MKLFRIDNGETHHICARDLMEAVACYDRTFGDPFVRGDDGITEVPQSEWPSLMVNDDDMPQKMPVTFYIGDPTNDRDAFLVCTTCV